MTLAKTLPNPTGPAWPPPQTSQYLKIAYTTKRWRMLDALAMECGCTWQSIALEAIDELLDREKPLKNQP